MDARVECTHCRVLMTSWSPEGSGIRYWQCPFCGHTHSSHYGEVFRAGAGARVVQERPGERYQVAGALPQPSAADINWAMLKARANRWFARLEQAEQPAPPRGAARVAYEPAAAGAARLPARHR